MSNEPVAVKVEPVIRKGKVAKRMILEQKVIQLNLTLNFGNYFTSIAV